MSVALLIPCHNAARFLPELFACVQAQTVPFDEILCYDDASTDDTVEVARSFGARVLQGAENRGAAFARNRLLEACTCDWLHFHDADDLIDPRFVETMNALARRDCRPVLCAMKVVEREGRRLVTVTHFGDLRKAEDPTAWLIEHTAYAIIGLYPLALVRQMGGFNENLRGNEDPDFHIRLALAGACFEVCDEALVTNLTRADSFSSSNWLRCMQDRLRCLQTYASGPLSPAQDRALGRDAVRIAYEFYRKMLYSEMDTALALGRERGIHVVDSRHALVRFCSRVTGLRLFFRLRTIAREWRP